MTIDGVVVHRPTAASARGSGGLLFAGDGGVPCGVEQLVLQRAQRDGWSV